MVTRTVAGALLLVALVALTACCNTAAKPEAEPPARTSVATAGWESTTPPDAVTAGATATPVQRHSDAEGLRSANRKLMDEVARLSTEVKWLKEGKADSGASGASPVPVEPVAGKKAVDVETVRAALVESGLTDLVVSRNTSGEVFVTLPGSLSFGSGKAELTPEAKERMRLFSAVMMSEFSEVSVRIEGHTDNDPIKRSKWESNEALSAARAQAVAVYLVRECDFPGPQAESRGFGAAKPVASNATPEGKAQNRRVELILVN